MFLMRFDALKCVFEACVSIFYSVHTFMGISRGELDSIPVMLSTLFPARGLTEFGGIWANSYIQRVQ